MDWLDRNTTPAGNSNPQVAPWRIVSNEEPVRRPNYTTTDNLSNSITRETNASTPIVDSPQNNHAIISAPPPTPIQTNPQVHQHPNGETRIVSALNDLAPNDDIITVLVETLEDLHPTQSQSSINDGSRIFILAREVGNSFRQSQGRSRGPTIEFRNLFPDEPDIESDDGELDSDDEYERPQSRFESARWNGVI